ncbi:MAG: hypothetical protein AAGA48_22100 [Myxococcota bacterium]
MWFMMALLWACGTSTSSPQPASAKAVLSAADKVDGTIDKTVSQCSGCGLGMEGDPAHAVQHEGFELHFCSETCATHFEKDPDAGVKRLESAVTPND